MKTAIVGGGRGCRSLLEFLLEGRLTELPLDVAIICETSPDAPGVVFAAERGIEICSELDRALRTPGLQLVVEVTGSDAVAEEIYRNLPPGVRVMDHTVARLFWDLINAERRLEREREFVQKILDSMPELVMVLDREMRIESVNEVFLGHTGLTREEAKGLKCHDALCGRDRVLDTEEHPCPFEEVLTTGRRATRVQVMRGPNGEEAYFELTMTPLEDEAGRVRRMVESLHPITERIRLKREVEASAKRFQQFIDSAQDLISIKGLDLRYRVVNPATAAFFDLEVEDCIDKTVHELFSPRIATLVSDHDREVIRKKEAISYRENLHVRGREHHFHTVRFPLLDYKGDVVGVCTISRDVTRERRLQRKLVQTDKFAALGKLAAAVAHEINNPLTGILAFAEDLRADSGEGDERIEDYDVIIRETLRCREIVKQLLDFAKPRVPHIQEASLGDVVTRTIALVSKLPVFRNIRIRVSEEEGLPRISGDAQQLQQVLLNLLMNAADVNPEGGEIRVETGIMPDGASCHLTVEDSGPGIPGELLGRIFDPFFGTKKASHGVGLAVSWGIVQRHGGQIRAENREEGGARFRVVLPIVEGDQ